MRALRSALITVLIGAIGGAGFPIYFYGFNRDIVLGGVIVGILISFTIAFIERTLLQERLRRMRFTPALILRTVVELIIITLFIIIGVLYYYSPRSDYNPADVIKLPAARQFLFGGELLAILVYALTLLLLINMIRQMSRMLGQNVLINMIVGKYSRPVEEERVFMFLDLDASTTIAERIGNIRYHDLLDEYVYDITQPILESHGEIYQYVGDEVVVTWSDGKKKTSLDCINCFFRISAEMERLAPKYKEKYGFIPGFKAGFHSGRVIAGQIGDIKKEIVFQGDVVNTASRIKETCSSLGAKMLISGELLNELPLENSSYKALRVGSFLLKGKEHEVELYSMTKI
jgi:adenylate cyclase